MIETKEEREARVIAMFYSYILEIVTLALQIKIYNFMILVSVFYLLDIAEKFYLYGHDMCARIMVLGYLFICIAPVYIGYQLSKLRSYSI